MGTAPTVAGIHHVKVPVVDLPRSIAWYGEVFGFEVTMEFPDDAGVVRGVGGTVPGLGKAMLTMRENPVAAEGCRGFDPFSFGVDDSDGLSAWVGHLDRLGIAHSPIIEASVGWLLVFHDPDGIEIHLYTWAGHGIDHSARSGYDSPIESASS